MYGIIKIYIKKNKYMLIEISSAWKIVFVHATVIVRY
jgi:hypothetical protein